MGLSVKSFLVRGHASSPCKSFTLLSKKASLLIVSIASSTQDSGYATNDSSFVDPLPILNESSKPTFVVIHSFVFLSYNLNPKSLAVRPCNCVEPSALTVQIGEELFSAKTYLILSIFSNG